MADSVDSNEDGVDLTERDAVVSRFVNLLKKYKFLLTASQVPKVRTKKKKIAIDLQKEYAKTFGKAMTVKQLKKKIQNLKTEVRRKIRSAGQNKIPLKEWERVFLELITKPTNATVQIKLSDSLENDFGITDHADMNTSGTSRQTHNLEEMNTPPQQLSSETQKQTAKALEILSEFETEETKHLTNDELQRLVLLEQLKLARIKIAKEEGWAKAIALKLKEKPNRSIR